VKPHTWLSCPQKNAPANGLVFGGLNDSFSYSP
jgi:hypothetical protein